MFETLIKNQVQAAMRKLGQTNGLAPYGTYFSKDLAGTTYDPSTGLTTPAVTQYDDVPMVYASYESDEAVDADTAEITQKVIIAAADLEVEPKVQDYLQDSSGQKHNVERVKGVPGKSVWILLTSETE